MITIEKNILFHVKILDNLEICLNIFLIVFQQENKSLPLKYNFNFVIDEISNINDKAQVCVSC